MRPICTGPGPTPPGPGMNQRAIAPARSWRWRHPRLPVTEICREVIDGKGGSLFIGPALRNGPEHIVVGGGLLREGSPLHVAHHPPTAALFHARQFAPGNERRRGA